MEEVCHWGWALRFLQGRAGVSITLPMLVQGKPAEATTWMLLNQIIVLLACSHTGNLPKIYNPEPYSS